MVTARFVYPFLPDVDLGMTLLQYCNLNVYVIVSMQTLRHHDHGRRKRKKQYKRKRKEEELSV